MAAFYVLVAVRALVPDLCQTQRQAKAIAERASCCAARVGLGDDAGGTRVEERRKAPAPCAFCLLAVTLVEPLHAFNASETRPSTAAARLFPPSIIRRSAPHAPWLGRSPPFA